MTQPPTGLNMHGAVDLSALARPAPSAPAVAAPDGVVIEVTAETFQDLVTTSMTVPVVVDLYSARAAASTQLSAALQQLAASYGGRFQLARVDADANPQIAQAVGAQSLPTTFAVIKGQPLPLFQGAYPAEQIQAVLDELLRVAAENGVTGTISAAAEDDLGEAEEPPEPPLPPHLEAAYEAIEAGDLDAAADGLTQALKEAPADAEAKALLAQVDLMRRLDAVDPVAALTAARDAAPGDVETQLVAADVEVSNGQSAAAYARLLAAVRASAGDDRDAARARLVELFQLAPPDDADVLKARRDLAIALY